MGVYQKVAVIDDLQPGTGKLVEIAGKKIAPTSTAAECVAAYTTMPKVRIDISVKKAKVRGTLISLRIDPRMLARIKRLARSRYLNYQSMIKQWLSERLETELRERERN